METSQNEINLSLPPTDKALFKKYIRRELNEIRREAAEAHISDNEIDPVPDSAYDDTYWLLGVLFDHNVSMPDIGWLMDGGIGFEWRSRDGKGIATMSIYGNNQVVYGATLGDMRRVKGTHTLSNPSSLVRFLTMLTLLFSQ